MTHHDVVITLKQLRDHAQEAVSMVADRSRKDLDTNRMLYLAITRLLGIVGEAARRAPEETRAKYPQIEWPQIVSIRNRIAHGYDLINLDVVWDVVTHDFPLLVSQVNEIIRGLDRE